MVLQRKYRLNSSMLTNEIPLYNQCGTERKIPRNLPNDSILQTRIRLSCPPVMIKPSNSNSQIFRYLY